MLSVSFRSRQGVNLKHSSPSSTVLSTDWPFAKEYATCNGRFEKTSLIGVVTLPFLLSNRFKIILLSIKIRLAIFGSYRAKMNAASLISSHGKSLDINC